jgi:hypothetical protein
MRFPAAFLMRILRAAASSEEAQGMIFIVVLRPYAYLQEELGQAFAGQGDVHVVVDRRNGERRARWEPVTTDRRQAERRRPKAEIVDVVIVD